MSHSRSFSLRRATAADGAELGRIQFECWHETYAGLVPDELLAGMCSVRRGRVWEEMLTEPSAYSDLAAYIAEREGQVLGFGCFGRQADTSLLHKGYDGEISSIYLLKSVQRCGLGTALMQRMALDLQKRGCAGAALWVLRENIQARRFYERLGGVPVAEKKDERPSGVLIEVGYGWSDLKILSSETLEAA
jgi:ribosomal protein S18 acetylase RimI-like enzyme